jgi:uncharacterized protein (TIGR02246 family)
MTSAIVNSMGVLAVAVSSAALAVAPPSQTEARAGIQATFDASAAAWSAGDLDRFMTCYENAPTTSYVSGTRFVQGYQAIRSMYAERFGGGSKAKMGQLSLEILDLRLLGDGHAYVVGRFHLHRAPADGGDASGLTTLVFHRTPAGWRIIADHS